MKTFAEKRVLLGFLFLLAGSVLLLEYFSLIPWVLPPVLISWKSFLLLLGIYFLVTSKDKTTGIILIVISSIFITGGLFDMRFWQVVKLAIPVVLIIAGIAIIMKRQLFSPKQINIAEGENINDYINETYIFAGGEKVIRSENFKGGVITAIFGGSEIDLRHSKLAPGVNAIDMMCIFGGVSLRVPEDWDVKIDVNPIFGGFSDERKLERREHPLNPEKTLYLKGMVVFGGGEIKT